MIVKIYFIILHVWFGWFLPCAYRLLVADLSGDEELLHGHVVHGGEVSGDILVAVVHVASAEILLKIDNKLGNHNGILEVSLNPVQSLHALITSISEEKRGYFYNISCV